MYRYNISYIHTWQPLLVIFNIYSSTLQYQYLHYLNLQRYSKNLHENTRKLSLIIFSRHQIPKLMFTFFAGFFLS